MRKAAFESLGPFLATFYNPDREVLEDIQSADQETETADNESVKVSSCEGPENSNTITENSSATNNIDTQEIEADLSESNNGE